MIKKYTKNLDLLRLLWGVNNRIKTVSDAPVSIIKQDFAKCVFCEVLLFGYWLFMGICGELLINAGGLVLREHV